MVDGAKDKSKGKDPKSESKSVSKGDEEVELAAMTPYEQLVKNLLYVERSVLENDRGLTMRALSFTKTARVRVNVEKIKGLANKVLSKSSLKDDIMSSLDKIGTYEVDDEDLKREAALEKAAADAKAAEKAEKEGSGAKKPSGDEAKEVEMKEPGEEEKKEKKETKPASKEDKKKVKKGLEALKKKKRVVARKPQVPPSTTSAAAKEILAYFHLFTLGKFIKYGNWEAVAQGAASLVSWTAAEDRRSLDVFTARGYALLSLGTEHEATPGKFERLRPALLRGYRTACLRRDVYGQATLVNLILRNMLHYNLYDQASKFLANISFPETASNNQLVRYLYYSGLVAAIQTDYSDAYASISNAVRKAPQTTGLGFTRAVSRACIVVQLLMGEMPDRSTFERKELVLDSYLALAQVVRVGDLKLFEEVVKKHSAQYAKDNLLSLVHRLGSNVIKMGLRKICASYSRISFKDIAVRLNLESPMDAEFACMKAIRDGVIDAVLDNSAGYLRSKEVVDVYSTTEPREAFDKRINFCLELYTDTIKGMRYQVKDAKKDESEVNVEDEVTRIAEDIEDGKMDEDDEEDDMDI